MKTPNARSTKTSAAAGRRKTPAGATTKATRGKKKKQVVASEEITSNKVLYAQWEIEHPLFEDDAAFLAWATETIPGAFPRCLYVGLDNLMALFDAKGQKPFTKAEIESLVIADGPTVACLVTELEFQPVSYVFALGRDLAEQLAAGKTIETAFHPRGGAFYSTDKGVSCVAVSGSVFKRDEKNGSYHFAGGSNLYRMAQTFGKRTGKPVWGWPLDRIKDQADRLQTYHAQGDAMRQFVESALEAGGHQYRRRGGNRRTNRREDKRHNEIRKRLVEQQAARGEAPEQ